MFVLRSGRLQGEPSPPTQAEPTEAFTALRDKTNRTFLLFSILSQTLQEYFRSNVGVLKSILPPPCVVFSKGFRSTELDTDAERVPPPSRKKAIFPEGEIPSWLFWSICPAAVLLSTCRGRRNPAPRIVSGGCRI